LPKSRWQISIDVIAAQLVQEVKKWLRDVCSSSGAGYCGFRCDGSSHSFALRRPGSAALHPIAAEGFWVDRTFAYVSAYFFDKWERFHAKVSAVRGLPGFGEVTMHRIEWFVRVRAAAAEWRRNAFPATN
jgi:hypothetical protein